MANSNALGIFYITSCLFISFLTSEMNKMLFISQGLHLRELAWQVQNMYRVFKLAVFFPVNVSNEVIVSYLSLGKRGLFLFTVILPLYLVVMQSEMTRLVSSEMSFLRQNYNLDPKGHVALD